MSLFRKERSPYYWGYLNVGGVIQKKSLGTDNKNQAEKLLFEWKSELMADKNSAIGEADTSMKMIQDYYYPQSQLDEKLTDFLRV